MNSRIRFLFLLCYLFFTNSVIGQSFITGKVIEVVDGRTVKIQTSYETVTVQIQFIEVPEPEQQLSGTVKEHLQKLVLGKSLTFYPQSGTQGKLYLDSIDVAMQMLRDGAAWYDLPSAKDQQETFRTAYQRMESLAKLEKRGVWGISGLKPAWEFRDEQYAKKIEESKKLKNISSQQNIAITYPVFPEKIKIGSFIELDEIVPKNFAVIGIGYRENNKTKLYKIIKKAQPGDLICLGQNIPSPFVSAQGAISEFCPTSGYGGNANFIEDANTVMASHAKQAIMKTATALRMYKVSGNYSEFEVKAREAISVTNTALPHISDNDLRDFLSISIGALTDAMLVRSSRNGNYGAKLSGSALLALNDKYGLGETSAYILDDKIIDVGIEYINKSGQRAKTLGLFDILK